MVVVVAVVVVCEGARDFIVPADVVGDVAGITIMSMASRIILTAA